METGRIKKRKVDSSLKRNKNECGLSNPPPMCNRETWWYYQIRSARKSYNYEKFVPLLLAQNLVVSTILAKTLHIGALSVDKLSIKHFTRGAIN